MEHNVPERRHINKLPKKMEYSVPKRRRINKLPKKDGTECSETSSYK